MNSLLTRRQFVTGIGVTGMALATTPAQLLARLGHHQRLAVLTGTRFHLSIGEQAVNFTGSVRMATTINNSLPAPILRFKEGELITLHVTNNLKETSSIHWHGLILPSQMDGVPGISDNFYGIKPGHTFTYQFLAKQSGTYWYHSHSGFQEQTGMYGAIVIDPIEKAPFEYDRDYVLVLSDWTDENPADIYYKLKKLSHYYNFSERTHADLMKDIRSKGLNNTWNDRMAWNQMRMSPRDLSDVTGYTYSYLINGQTADTGWVGLFNKGEKVRLRFINGSAMSFFDVRIPGLKMKVVAADGQNIQPVSVDEFRIGVAETYDVIVEPESDRAWTIFAQDIARSGYARGTLTPDKSVFGEVPELDPIAELTHSDMGMDGSHHAGMDHSKMEHNKAQSKGVDHSKMGHNKAQSKGVDHSKMGHNKAQSKGVDHSKMGHNKAQSKGVDHSKMGHNKAQSKGVDHSKMGHNKAQSKGVDHSKMGHNKAQSKGVDHSKMEHHKAQRVSMVSHAATEFGPHVDMRASSPQYRLDDPGPGLRNNGRRVLTYADLYNLHKTQDYPAPDRELQLHLTGNMRRYMWSINGVKFADAEPLVFKFGEVIRVTLVNDTMMNHPMHLHGIWSDLETGDNDYLPRKHTVVVQPGAKISYLITADARGAWAYHCHLLYHMLGMFRQVNVV